MTEVFKIEGFDWYTIETLQKLCYYKETASSAVKLLFEIGNRQNQLKQKASMAFESIFQSRLGETCLKYEERLEVLEDIEKTIGINQLLILAYQRGLKGYGYTSDIHSGDVDYIDKQFNHTEEEELGYFKKLIVKLKLIALENQNDNSELAKRALMFRLKDQAIYGDFNGIMAFVEEISKKEKILPQEIRVKLLELNSMKFNLGDDKNQRINKILEKYAPKTVEQELEIIVVNAPWIYEKREDGSYMNISGQKAKELAGKYYKENNQEWLNYLDILLTGEQKQTFAFGEEIAELWPKIITKLNLIKIVFALRKIEPEQQNGVFLNGVVKGYDDDEFTRFTVDFLLKDDTTCFFSLLVTKLIKKLSFSDLEKIKPILQKGEKYLFNIEYLDYSSLSNDEFIKFINWIKEINQSFALQLIWELLRKNENKWDELKDTVNDLVFKDDVLEYSSSINSKIHIEDLILKSLKDNSTEHKINFVTERLLEKYQDYSFNDEAFLNNLLYSLLDSYWEVAWPIIGEFLLDSSKSSFGLRTFLDRITFDNKRLYLWALVNDKNASIAIKFMKVFEEGKDGRLLWDSYAKRLIDEKGNANKFLENLRGKFVNYSIVGASAEELYVKRKKLLKSLENSELTEVREFAFSMEKILEKNIEEERMQRENYE